MSNNIRRVAINGAELGYDVHEAAPSGPPLIFLHGYAMRSTGALYDELLAPLATHFTVYALDLRGHGASADSIADWSFETLADDVEAFSQALGLHQPVLIGHSFGGVIALLAALRHPRKFSALCLLSPGPADHRRDPVDTLDFMIEHGHDREALRGAFRQMFVRPPGLVLERTLDAVTLVHASVHRAQKRQNPHFSIDDLLQDVTPPVLLVCGGSDTVVPPEKQLDMAGKLPHSKAVLVSTEGHMMAIESPPSTAREVSAFLQNDLAALAYAAKEG